MKLSAGAAGAAFLLSLLIGLVSGAGFVLVLIRALVFAALFFGLSVGAYQLLSRFLPELLGLSGAENAEVDSELGSRIDLVVGDEVERPIVDKGDAIDRPRKRVALEDEAEEAEELEAFMPADEVAEAAASAEAEGSDEVGLDQGREGRYTGRKDAGGASVALGGRGVEPALPPGLLDDVDVMPDLESMSDSFVSPLVDEATERSSGESFPSRSSTSSRSSEIGGDFDTHEMVSAIQTILKRDQKG